ncbi:hypothetical protein APT89_17620 [Enterobacter sp. 50588862]|nr:hypothetical protein APT89_17620 [Enterobacter sp. 50588862]
MSMVLARVLLIMVSIVLMLVVDTIQNRLMAWFMALTSLQGQMELIMAGLLVDIGIRINQKKFLARLSVFS